MKNNRKHQLRHTMAALGVAMFCLCATAPVPAQAESEYRLASSRGDILGAHNDRMLVVFGGKVRFMKYFLVDMLRQSVTVATDVPGVHYDVRDTGRDRVLVID